MAKTSQNITPLKQKQNSAGHRKRLRKKFLQGGLDSFLDYEIVELLLTLGTPRKDCKPIAKKVIKKFGNLCGVLDASPEDLQDIHGIGLSNIFGLKLFQEISERYTKEKISKKATLNNPEAIFDYLKSSIGKEKKENFVMLSLNSQNQLIGINKISTGTISASLVHPREVFYPAIKNLATQIILAHNHPSGNPEPSPEDVAITRQLEEVSQIINIPIIDHIIVTSRKYLSMKKQGLI